MEHRSSYSRDSVKRVFFYFCLVVNLDSSISTPSSAARSPPDIPVLLSPPLRPISWYPSCPSCSFLVWPPRLRPAITIHRQTITTLVISIVMNESLLFTSMVGMGLKSRSYHELDFATI